MRKCASVGGQKADGGEGGGKPAGQEDGKDAIRAGAAGRFLGVEAGKAGKNPDAGLAGLFAAAGFPNFAGGGEPGYSLRSSVMS